jgi:hypothetical protein
MRPRRSRNAFTDQVERSWATGEPLDPRNAVTITVREMYALADRPLEPLLLPEAAAFATGGLTALGDQRTDAAKLLLTQMKK